MDFTAIKYQRRASSDCIQIKAGRKQIILLIDDHDKHGFSVIWKGLSPQLSDIHAFIASLNFSGSHEYHSVFAVIRKDNKDNDELIDTRIKKPIQPFPHGDDQKIIADNKIGFARYDIFSPQDRVFAVTVELSGRKGGLELGVKADIWFYRKIFDKLAALIKNTCVHKMNAKDAEAALSLLLSEYEKNSKNTKK